MKRTSEQEAVVAASTVSGRLVVNALAGSGKTTTAIECVVANKAKNPRISIGYFCFNRSVAETMRGKLRARGLRQGVDATTMHALAFKAMRDSLITGRTLGNLKAASVADILERDLEARLREGAGRNERVRAVRTVLDRFDAWTRSAAADLDEFLAAPVPVPDLAAMEACGLTKAGTDALARTLWDRVTGVQDGPDCPLPHSAYLKAYQVSAAAPRYDLAIFDEAQDLSPVLESLALKMAAAGSRVVFVGDKYQQIYGWNGAVNSVQRMERGADTLALTQSFRCPGNVTGPASDYLGLLGFTGTFRPADSPCTLDWRCPLVLSRSNAALLANIMRLQSGEQRSRVDFDKIHLVGGASTYSFDAVLDCLNLIDESPGRIASPVVAAMSGLEEYTAYAEETCDAEMRAAAKIVASSPRGHLRHVVESIRHGRFCDDLPGARVALSTAHKAKGSEFRSVMIDSSFVNVAEFARQALGEARDGPAEYDMEELRLNYVSLTRSTDELDCGPLTLRRPSDFEAIDRAVGRKAMVFVDGRSTVAVKNSSRQAQRAEEDRTGQGRRAMMKGVQDDLVGAQVRP
jgi:superfamily I DNA/RNA helicase